nr:reverse transcriptase domain-containing protein [Tanacetum cinerariifolium]
MVVRMTSVAWGSRWCGSGDGSSGWWSRWWKGDDGGDGGSGADGDDGSVAAIRKLVADSIAAALKTQTTTLAEADNSIREIPNAYAQPIGMEQANRITWTYLKRLLTNKYCPRTEIKKMEDEFYNLSVKDNNLKTYVRRFQELAVLCPNKVPNNEKLMKVFIGGLPRSIEGNVTTLKP